MQEEKVREALKILNKDVEIILVDEINFENIHVD